MAVETLNIWNELSLEERDHIIEEINDMLEYEYYFVLNQ